MSTVDTLLDEELDNGYTVLTIDEPTRSIQYEGTLVLGVEHDKYAERIYFVAPKIVGDDIDLSASTTRIDVKFTNGYGDSYYVQSTDLETQDDERVKFSWLLTEKVAEVQGNVSFCVCVKQLDDSSVVEKEWHTAPYVGKIIQGVDATMEDLEIITDYTCPTYQMVQKVEEYEAALETMTEEFNSKLDGKSDSTHTHALATKESDGLMASSDKRSVLQSASDIVTIKGDVEEIKDDVEEIKDDIKSLTEFQEQLEIDLDSFKGTSTQFQLLTSQKLCKTATGSSDITENTTGYIDLETYMKGYNEWMILIRINSKTGSSNESIGISEDGQLGVTSNQGLNNVNINVASAPTYNVINAIKTSDKNYCWIIDGKFNWTNNDQYRYLYHYSGGSTNDYSVTVKVYGR